jgi:hypothetical protein
MKKMGVRRNRKLARVRDVLLLILQEAKMLHGPQSQSRRRRRRRKRRRRRRMRKRRRRRRILRW